MKVKPKGDWECDECKTKSFTKKAQTLTKTTKGGEARQ
jgi:hypothetical protein